MVSTIFIVDDSPSISLQKSLYTLIYLVHLFLKLRPHLIFVKVLPLQMQ